MSVKIFGILEFCSPKLPLAEKMQFCFFVVQKATKNKIGIRLGCNVSSNFKEKFKNFRGMIPIELTDNPLIASAESLLAKDKNLSSRMTSIQSFLCEILKSGHINKITLDINIQDGEKFETIEINAHDFCRKMLELYDCKKNCIPTIRIIIKG